MKKGLLVAALACSSIATAQVTFTIDNSLSIPSGSHYVRAAVDMNGDYLDDIVCTNSGNITILYQQANGSYTTASMNNNGHLDAFMCHDVAPNVYYLNDGSGNLVFNQGCIGNHAEGGNYGSIWVDYDNDGDQDCFIAKCRGGGSTASIDELHQNNGDGTFTDVTVAANMTNGFHQAWSAAWNDYDNDGDMDAMIGESGWGGSSDGHKLMRNNGDGTFTDITSGS